MKNKVKYFLAVMLLYESGVFATSDTTKQLINKYLAKYGITSNKQDCETGKEPEYIENTGKVKCKNDKQDDTNNCWDASTRLCKECPSGTVVSQRDHTTCRQIVCPKGWRLVRVINGRCPKGFRKEPIKNNSCGIGFKSYTEQVASNNYKTLYKNCNNLQGGFIVPIEFDFQPSPIDPIIWNPVNPIINPIDLGIIGSIINPKAVDPVIIPITERPIITTPIHSFKK